jgi:hypothetical protein
LGPFGLVIEGGRAERDVEGAVAHEFFDHLQCGPGIEKLGGKRVALMPRAALAALCRTPTYAEEWLPPGGSLALGRMRRGIIRAP